jgi:hypothetical protein
MNQQSTFQHKFENDAPPAILEGCNVRKRNPFRAIAHVPRQSSGLSSHLNFSSPRVGNRLPALLIFLLRAACRILQSPTFTESCSALKYSRTGWIIVNSNRLLYPYLFLSSVFRFSNAALPCSITDRSGRSHPRFTGKRIPWIAQEEYVWRSGRLVWSRQKIQA